MTYSVIRGPHSSVDQETLEDLRSRAPATIHEKLVGGRDLHGRVTFPDRSWGAVTICAEARGTESVVGEEGPSSRTLAFECRQVESTRSEFTFHFS